MNLSLYDEVRFDSTLDCGSVFLGPRREERREKEERKERDVRQVV
jgi:hypothetical protein